MILKELYNLDTYGKKIKENLNYNNIYIYIRNISIITAYIYYSLSMSGITGNLTGACARRSAICSSVACGNADALLTIICCGCSEYP